MPMDDGAENVRVSDPLDRPALTDAGVVDSLERSGRVPRSRGLRDDPFTEMLKAVEQQVENRALSDKDRAWILEWIVQQAELVVRALTWPRDSDAPSINKRIIRVRRLIRLLKKQIERKARVRETLWALVNEVIILVAEASEIEVERAPEVILVTEASEIEVERAPEDSPKVETLAEGAG
jgi:hypothetical protein